MSYSAGLLTISEIEDQADKVKALVVNALVQQDLLDDRIAEGWSAAHTIVLRKKSIFRTISDRWNKEEEKDNRHYFSVVECIFPTST